MGDLVMTRSKCGMPSADKCGSPSLPRKLLEYITEVQRRSGVKLDVTRAHAASIELELDAQKQGPEEQEHVEEMDMFSRPRSRTSGFQATSPLAIAQRRNAAEATQRPKSAYLLNGHCELNTSNSSAKDPHDGYHTDGEETHQVTLSSYQQTINHYRRMYESPMNNNLVDSQRFSSASSICSSEDEDNNDGWLSFRKSQSDIGTMRVQCVEQNNELLEKIKMLEKQNEMLKQQLEDKTMKDEATQVQYYSVAPIQPIRVKQLAPLKFQQQLEDMEGIDSGSQVFHMFMDAERTYVNGLLTLVRQFFLPMKMFSACRPHVLPLLQLDAIFLNCEQLMWYHQSLFSAMMRIDQSTDAQMTSDFLNTLDKFLPGLTVYTPFLALGHQTFQHELKLTLQNAEVSELVAHCEELSRTSLEELFVNIFERFDHYKNLLVLFLRLPESNEPREEQVCNMIDYIKALAKEISSELCDWNVMTAKIKILQSITDSSMLPVEIFDTNVHYIKQGNLLHVVDNVEKSCVCLLFTTHVALANKTTDYKIEIVNPGMMALCGATLYDRVDITGHPLQEDFQTGLRQDQLGFKIQFHNKQGIYLRVSKPSHLREWLQQFSEAINYAHKNCSSNAKNNNNRAGIDLGPRIAAASLEKLFQQLTNPVNSNKEFQGTFFMTYRLFTTAEDVLTALINCLLQKNDASKNRFSDDDDAEVFSYHSSAANSDDEGDEIVCSPSMDTLESINSACVINFHSEQESPTNSTYNSPVTSRKTFASRPGPQRNKKSDKSSGEPVEAFATARGTVKAKRRFSHEEGVHEINNPIIRKSSLVRASSDSNIVHNVGAVQHQLSSDDSSNSLTNYQQVAPTDTLTPPLVSISPSEGDMVSEQVVKIKRQFTSDTSRSFSTGSDHYGDMESDGEGVTSPDVSCPTPKVSIQLPVLLETDNTTNSNNDNCGTLVSEMLEQFPSLLTSPVLSNISQRNDFSHSLPNNLNMVGLDQLCSEEHSTMRSNSITGSVECMTVAAAASNSWLLTKAMEGRTLSEIHEDSAESRASTKSPSPIPADRTLRPRCDAFSDIAALVNITRLESNKSDSFDRKMAATQESEQPRVRPIENGRRGSFLARFLPMRGKGKRHQSESEMHSSSSGRQNFVHSHPIPVRPASPSSFESSLPVSLKTATSKKTRFPSVLRRKKEIVETLSLSPTRDFSMSGGRLSPSPGARYSDSAVHRRSILRSIYNNLDYWILRHKEDFIYDKGLKDRLLSFLEEHLLKVALHDQEQMEIIEDTIFKFKEVTLSDVITDKSLSNMLQRTIQLDYNEEMLSWVNMTEQPLSNASIVNLNPKQLARQLMLLEYALYAAIERRELIGCCWKHKNKETEAPNVCRVIKHSNKLTSWVMTAILQQEAIQGRAAAIELFIKVASECLKHNDAQSCVLITCALNSCCVRHDRLKLSWEQVSSKVRQKYDKLVKFSNPDRRCRSMRAHLEKQQPPGVPYTGGYLEHLWAIDNGQNTYTPEGLVNFAKMTALCSAVRSFLRFQSESYTFEPDFKLMHYIMAAERLDDEQLYHLSKQREP